MDRRLSDKRMLLDIFVATAPSSAGQVVASAQRHAKLGPGKMMVSLRKMSDELGQALPRSKKAFLPEHHQRFGRSPRDSLLCHRVCLCRQFGKATFFRR